MREVVAKGTWTGPFRLSTLDQAKPIFHLETETVLFTANSLKEVMEMWHMERIAGTHKIAPVSLTKLG
jgi:hypothetical protein